MALLLPVSHNKGLLKYIMPQMIWNKVNVLIIGASGMLGKDIASFFAATGRYNVFAVYRNSKNKLPCQNIVSANIDITDSLAFGNCLREIKPKIIIHCAAIVNVDSCETNSDYANKLHSESIRQIAESAPTAKLIYISTDSVFDGSKGNYSEKDLANPLNYYAKSKYNGESNTLKLFKNSIVIRTNIYGFHFQKQSSLVEWALDNLRQGKKLNGFTDVHFNPVYTKQLAETIYQLTELGFDGLINIASDTFINKYSFLVKIAETFGFDPSLIEAASVNSVNFMARRPKNTTLNTDLLKSIIGTVPDFSNGIKRLYSDYKNFSNNIGYEEHQNK
jgi:dTDP-4-dehydrorhamnose reductase